MVAEPLTTGTGLYGFDMRWNRAVITWFLIVVAESVHGTMRQLFIAPLIGDRLARQIGVLTGSGIIFAIALASIRWIGLRSFAEQFRVGFLWAVMMLVFEFGLGAALGYSWERMLSDYALTKGGFMGLGLIFLLFAPALAIRVRNFKSYPAVSDAERRSS